MHEWDMGDKTPSKPRTSSFELQEIPESAVRSLSNSSYKRKTLPPITLPSPESKDPTIQKWFEAIVKNDAATVKLFLAQDGFDPNVTNKNGFRISVFSISRTA